MTEHTPLAGYQPYVPRAIPSPERRVYRLVPEEWPRRVIWMRSYVVEAPRAWSETRRAWGRPG